MGAENISFTGGCSCGAIRYQCTAQPLITGSLDDPSWFHPQMDFLVSDAQPWDRMDPAIPKFKHYPPRPPKG